MANNDVIVDAAVDGSDTGNVIIEGVKYFPQKKEICSKDDYEHFVVMVEADPYSGAKDFIYDDGGDIQEFPGINSKRLPGLNFLMMKAT